MTIPDENWRPEPKGTLNIGGLKTFSVPGNEKRIVLEVPFECFPYEPLSALYADGNWLDVTLSTIACQLKSWSSPKVSTYSFLGKLISLEKMKAGTAITLDIFGGVQMQQIDV